MKLIKAAMLALALLISVPTFAESESVAYHPSHMYLRWSLCQETYDHYTKWQYTRDWNEYRTFMYSAYRVGQMFPMYPAKNELDRMLLLYEFGQHETKWKKDFAVVNVPDAKYKGGEMKVGKFTVDYTAWGLNQGNVTWTYNVAKRIQEGRSLPEWLPKKTRELLAKANIPKDLKLNRIDLSIARRAKKKYRGLVAKGYEANEIRKQMKISGYEENTQDQIDSALIYRVIVEIDRMSRGWTWGIENYNQYTVKADRTLYKRLSKKIEDYYYVAGLRKVQWNNMTYNNIRKNETAL